MNENLNSIVLIIIAIILVFMTTEVINIHDLLKNDNNLKIEKNIHFNRWYDIQAFKGTQINVTEIEEWNPFTDKNMLKYNYKNMMNEKLMKEEGSIK